MSRLFRLIVAMSLAAGCAGLPKRAPSLAQNRELDALSAAAAWPGSDPTVSIVAAQQFMAARREVEGYEYFHRLAAEQPQRPILSSLEGLMQARIAGEVFLLRRVAWVEDAIRKLDRGAEAEPIAGRLLRGLVFADLPGRFGKANQAVDDLQASLANRDVFPFDLDRGIYRALASAYRTLGDEARSREMLRRSGTASLDDGTPSVLSTISVGPQPGFRFTSPRLVKEADGVYVAEGFDFANIAFIVNEAGVIAIDAGTTEESAAAAMQALRRVTSAPIRYVILTHAHWDHVGGLPAVREPGTVVIARANFARELERVRSSQGVFRYFFGSGRVHLDARPDRLVSTEEVLHHGGLELRLIPAPSGETEDALFVHLPQQGLLFVGDAFMPYVGPPFLPEGSPEGYLEALAKVRSLAPRRLVHGHPPLTRLFNVHALPGLELALRGLYERYAPQLQRSRPLAEILHENYLPPSLRETPKAVVPYLVVRDHFLQRLQLRTAGYWQADGSGIESFTRAEWGALLDQFAGGSDEGFVRVAEDLLARSDAPLALQVVEMGLLKHPGSRRLEEGRRRALSMLIERYNPVDPFRFIVYSEFAGFSLPPLAEAPPSAERHGP